MIKIWKKSYKCGICGGIDHTVSGKARRCVVCRSAYMRKFQKQYRIDLNEYRRERYKKKRIQLRKSLVGLSAASLLDDRTGEIVEKRVTNRQLALRNGKLIYKDLQKIKARDNSCCIYCGLEVKTRCCAKDPRGFDHLFPLLSEEGCHELWNLAVCCVWCNNNKGNRSFLEYVEDEEISLSTFKGIPNVHFGLAEEIILDEDDFWE